jgi:hypothetical protein
MGLVVSGMLNKQIAYELGTSEMHGIVPQGSVFDETSTDSLPPNEPGSIDFSQPRCIPIDRNLYYATHRSAFPSQVWMR